jgi:hypothetical protein
MTAVTLPAVALLRVQGAPVINHCMTLHVKLHADVHEEVSPGSDSSDSV